MRSYNYQRPYALWKEKGSTGKGWWSERRGGEDGEERMGEERMGRRGWGGEDGEERMGRGREEGMGREEEEKGGDGAGGGMGRVS